MGKRFNYTPEHLEFLRLGYRAMRVPELTRAFNAAFNAQQSEAAIRSVLRANRFNCGRPRGNPVGSIRIMTPEQREYLETRYKDLPLRDLVADFNVTFDKTLGVNQVRAFLRNHGITCGRSGQFEKGHKPFNAGTRGFMKPNSGSFKKGHTPGNTKPLGHERICAKDGYILVKVAEPNPYTGAPTRYRHKHQVVWEAEHGPIPDGCVVAFRDGDRMNCHLDNLVLMTRAELRYLNKQFPGIEGEFRETAIAVAKVATKMFAAQKEAS